MSDCRFGVSPVNYPDPEVLLDTDTPKEKCLPNKQSVKQRFENLMCSNRPKGGL